MKKIGLLFGTFNPIHKGHLQLANYFVQRPEIEEVWFVISPQSPFKTKETLLDNQSRLEMVQCALEGLKNVKISTVEFNRAQPNYTSDTLAHLRKCHPDLEFILLMGADNMARFSEWKNHQEILQNHHIYVYPRAWSTAKSNVTHSKIHYVNAPMVGISSTTLKNNLGDQKFLSQWLPSCVIALIRKNNWYRS